MPDTKDSTKVSTNQIGINPKLSTVVLKNLSSDFEYPISPQTRNMCQKLKERQARHAADILLDSGCGTGDSTITIAQNYPNSLVLGIDKSEKRLHKALRKRHPGNAHFIRANLVDFWLGLKYADVKVAANFIFYPNPWPKQKDLKNRWHGHPIMTVLAELSDYIELRTNWHIYAKEFWSSLNIFTDSPARLRKIRPNKPISAFEKKYLESGHGLFQITYGANPEIS
ncbi:MAG: methyltransferase domain-containing protein [Pseudomonadota bacterium]|nr:methyltransferase domain-containing protein [Pseudomonadota bacterium]